MVNHLPPVIIRPPEVAPPANGLYAHTTPETRGDSRHLGGLTLLPVNEGPAGRFAPDCPGPEGVYADAWTVWEGEDFPPTTVWAAATLGIPGETDAEAQERARHVLDLQESVQAEAHAAELLVSRAEDVPPVGEGRKDRIVNAVAEIEARFAADGLPAVIHAPARYAAYVAEAGMMVKDGPRGWTTHLGSRWVFGGGYEGLGDRLVATGPVTVVRGEVRIYTGLDPRKNERLVIAHRDLAVSWESEPVTVQIETEA